MNRERFQQHSGLDLGDESWNLNELEPPSEQNELSSSYATDPEYIGSEVSVEELSADQQLLRSPEYGRFLALYCALMQNSKVFFPDFVKTRFIPEHVMSKGPAGRRHYHAILKHILKPETVEALFDAPTVITTMRLRAVPGWPYLDDVRLCDLRPEHVRKLISAALNQGYSVQTVKHIRSVIATIITHATKRRCFSGDNPALQVPLPKMIRRKAENLTLAQAKQLLAVMKYPDREIAIIAIFTGLNMLEICGLQWKHVNLTEAALDTERSVIPPRTIAVRKQWNLGELDDVRGCRNRNVEIFEPLLSLLRSLSRKNPFEDPNDFVLVSRAGTALWPAYPLQSRLKPLGRELGMPWLSWHVFNKAHKTLLSELRTDLSYPAKPRQRSQRHSGDL